MSRERNEDKQAMTEKLKSGTYIVTANASKRMKHDVWSYMELVCHKDTGLHTGYVRCMELYTYVPANGIKLLVKHRCGSEGNSHRIK